MAELLADLQDINTQLPPNVQIDNSVDVGLQVDAQRLIAGQLVNTFPVATVQGWDNPTDTPPQIRAIAGRLIASKYYAKLISGEAADAYPEYAISLYNEAIAMLSDIRSGEVIVTDPGGTPIPGITADSDPQGDMFPNDSTVGPLFTIERIINSTL